MDLVSYSAEDLSSLRPNDYFFEPSSRKIYQYRNKEGKAIIVRELGTTNITKLFKNVLKTVLKVESDFDKYQVINISDTSITLFNINIGESFELGFGDASDSIEEMRNAFNKGDEVEAEVFDYDDVRQIIKLSIVNASTSQESDATQETQLSEAELKRIKEIEDKKAKKRPFNASQPAKTTSKPTSKSQPKEAKKEVVKEKVSSKKPTKKVEASTKEQPKKEVVKEKVSSKKPAKKVEIPVKEEPKKETKEEKKSREKREKEEQKEREKREKEAKKAREKAEKEAKKGKKGK